MKFSSGLCLTMLFAACGGPVAPWPAAPHVSIDLKVSSSASSVPVLGEFELTLDLYHRSDLPVEFAPVVPDGFDGKVLVVEAQEFGGGIWQHAVIKLRPVSAPGKLMIPPFVAKATDGSLSATTPELELEVLSLLADKEKEAALEAPSDPLSMPVRWGFLALLAASLIAGIFLIGWFYRRSRRPPPLPISIPVPPHVRALRELQRLRSAARSSEAEVDAFYVATSDVLRRYLEERFGLHAPERTTEEFLLEVEHAKTLSNTQWRELRSFLDKCDLVKFAALRPDEAVHQATLDAAERFVEDSRADRAFFAKSL